MPLRLRAVYCLASALQRIVSPCIALALPCVAVPLRFSAVLCYAAAIPRPGNSSLINATAMSRFSSLCPRFSLHSLAVAILRIPYPASPLPCSVLRNFAFAIQSSPMPSPNTSSQHITIAKLLLAVQCPRCTVPFTAKPLRYTAIRAVAYSTISYRNLPQEALRHCPSPLNCP